MDVYQIITNRIIDLLEQGTVPWRKAWSTGSNRPRNIVSNKAYRGINLIMLSAAPYGSPYWLTYKQAQEKGGHVRSGEKSSIAVFWKLLDKQDDEDPTTSKYKVPLLRYYHLFNVEQCNGIDIPPIREEAVNPFTPLQQAELIVSGYTDHPHIRHGGGRAFYRPSEDLVQMPPQHTFKTSEDYYTVLFHELAHSTGAKHRLCRNGVVEYSRFGSDHYSAEELVAEFTAAYLCGHIGISNQTLEQSAAYIDGWLSVLKKDKRMLISASAQAQKAADYILGNTESNQQEVKP